MKKKNWLWNFQKQNKLQKFCSGVRLHRHAFPTSGGRAPPLHVVPTTTGPGGAPPCLQGCNHQGAPPPCHLRRNARNKNIILPHGCSNSQNHSEFCYAHRTLHGQTKALYIFQRRDDTSACLSAARSIPWRVTWRQSRRHEIAVKPDREKFLACGSVRRIRKIESGWEIV